MEHADVEAVLKLVGAALTAIIIGVGGWFSGKRRKTPEEDSSGIQVLAGSVVDSRVFRDATDAMRRVQQAVENFAEQQHADSRALRSVMEDVTTAVRRNTEAQDQGAVSPRDLAALIGRLSMKGSE